MKVLFPDGITGLANDQAFLAILGALFKAGSRVFAVECIKIIFCRLVQAVQNQVESLYVPLPFRPHVLAKALTLVLSTTTSECDVDIWSLPHLELILTGKRAFS